MEKGIKPVFVFDGKPPELKGGEVFLNINKLNNNNNNFFLWIVKKKKRSKRWCWRKARSS